MRYTFQDALTPGVIRRREGSENGKTKKKRRAAVMSGMMGYLQRLFTWIEPEKDGPVNKEYELSEAYMQLAKNLRCGLELT